MKTPSPKKKSQDKFHSHLCDNKMTFEDCELAILRQAVDESELKSKMETVNGEHISKIIKILENFLIEKKLICYGGTAINNILPEEVQFYDKSIEIPDYDFYSKDAMNDAIELADIYYKEGYTEVEAKSGVHYGTFKVFVNFIPIADITFLNPIIFDAIKKESIEVDSILYAPPNFLRLNMYLELSRPSGDVSRWEKVLKRLTLLNKHYPLKDTENCSKVELLRKMNKKSSNISEIIYQTTRDTFINENVVFFGGYATSLYTKYMKHKMRKNIQKNPDFDVLAIDPELVVEKVVKNLEKKGIKNITIIHHEEIGEIIPLHFEIQVDEESIAFVYKTIACHSYNTLLLEDKNINVATIDTMLTLYLAFYYVEKPYYYRDRIMCMVKFLFYVEQNNRLEQKELLKRFSISCYGHQDTLSDIRLNKTNKFKELKDKVGTIEYNMWFLKYSPEDKKNKNPYIKSQSFKKHRYLDKKITPIKKKYYSNTMKRKHYQHQRYNLRNSEKKMNYTKKNFENTSDRNRRSNGILSDVFHYL